MQTETPTRPVPAANHVEMEGPSIKVAIRSGAVFIHDGTAEVCVLSSEFDSIRRAMKAAEQIEASGADSFPVKGGE